MPSYTVLVVVDTPSQREAFGFVEAAINTAVGNRARLETYEVEAARVSTPDGTRSVEFDISPRWK